MHDAEQTPAIQTPAIDPAKKQELLKEFNLAQHYADPDLAALTLLEQTVIALGDDELSNAFLHFRRQSAIRAEMSDQFAASFAPLRTR